MILGLVGFIGSGKGTVAEILVSKGCQTDSFAAPLKDACSAIFGWPRYLLEGDTVESREFRETPDMFWSSKTGINQFTPRLALQLIGTDVMRNHFNENIWLNSLEYRFRCACRADANIVVSDARFKNELRLIQQLGGKVIWVQRGDLPEWYDCAKLANEGDAAAKKEMCSKYKHVHVSEWEWIGFDFDYTITNDSTIANLQKAVEPLFSSATPSLQII